MIDIVPYEAVRHRRGVHEVLAKNGREKHYVAGQLACLDALSGDQIPGTRSKVCVCEAEGRLSGFVCVEYREWNRLGQLQGLAVDPALKRRGIAADLVHRVEEFVRAEGGRGLYVDTPVTNETGRSFYEALGYRQAYVMPEYYGEGIDGVTYLKLFPKLEVNCERSLIQRSAWKGNSSNCFACIGFLGRWSKPAQLSNKGRGYDTYPGPYDPLSMAICHPEPIVVLSFFFLRPFL